MGKILKRTKYIDRIRPFFDSDIIKVITGIRRSGKSKLLDMIIDELKVNGVDEKYIIKINFDDMDFDYLTDAKAWIYTLRNTLKIIKNIMSF